jgi:hypothetical protein
MTDKTTDTDKLDALAQIKLRAEKLAENVDKAIDAKSKMPASGGTQSAFWAASIGASGKNQELVHHVAAVAGAQFLLAQQQVSKATSVQEKDEANAVNPK